MSRRKPNLLLFLGAGFSADAGLPTQQNFFEHARMKYNQGRLDKRQYAGITAAQVLPLVGSNEEDQPTMEEAFGMLDYMFYMKDDNYSLGHKWGDDWVPSMNSQLNVEKAREYFIDALEIIFGYNRAENTYFNHILYYNFFEKLLEHYDVYIITTNYDLVCESVLNKMIGRDVILFPVITYANFKMDYVPVPLLKLHGSIDWKETKVDLPNIIPPTWSKHFERKSKYNRIWNEAENAIAYSDKIIFIGYSMPETDNHVRYLLKWGGYANNND